MLNTEYEVFTTSRNKKSNSFKGGPSNQTRHHRRPVSLGGESIRKNISYVPHFKHKAWHILFDNFNVLKILGLFQEYYDVFCVDKGKSASRLRRDKEWIQAKPYRIRKQQAWSILFRGLSGADRFLY